MNARNPMFSRIELARPSRGVRPDNDGRLEVRELLALDVRSPLVFLSGCETGAFEAWLDVPVRGSGDHTLSHGFLAAGAENVVSTLWRIDDAASEYLARAFYGSLRTHSAADALVSAQRTLLREARFAAPYFWAAYVLSGDGGFTLAPQKGALASVY